MDFISFDKNSISSGLMAITLFLRYSFISSSSIRFIFSFISFLSRLQTTCLESINAFLIFLFLCWNSAFVKLEYILKSSFDILFSFGVSLTTVESIFFLNVHGTFFRVNHMLDHHITSINPKGEKYYKVQPSAMME